MNYRLSNSGIFLCFIFILLKQAGAQDSVDCSILYTAGEYKHAVECFNEQVLHLEADNRIDSLAILYPMLGASYVMAEKPDLAKATFSKLLLIRPEIEIDPAIFHPDIVAIFQMAKKENREKLFREHAIAPKAYPLAINFLPAGIPQYLNGDKRKSIVCAVIQIGALACSIYGYSRLEHFKSNDFGFKEEDYPDAGRAASLHLGGFLVFTGAFLYSVADGLIHRPEKDFNVDIYRQPK